MQIGMSCDNIVAGLLSGKSSSTGKKENMPNDTGKGKRDRDSDDDRYPHNDRTSKKSKVNPIKKHYSLKPDSESPKKTIQAQESDNPMIIAQKAFQTAMKAAFSKQETSDSRQP